MGLVREIMGTPGPLRARETLLQPRTCVGDIISSHTSFAQYCPPEPRTGLCGHAQTQPMVGHTNFALYCPSEIPYGAYHRIWVRTEIWAGPVRACPWCPMVARTNWYPYNPQSDPVWGLYGPSLGRCGHSAACQPVWMPVIALDKPVRAPCGVCLGNHGALRACPYGAHSEPGARPV